MSAGIDKAAMTPEPKMEATSSFVGIRDPAGPPKALPAVGERSPDEHPVSNSPQEPSCQPPNGDGER